MAKTLWSYECNRVQNAIGFLTILHSEWPKLHRVLNPVALRRAKTPLSVGLYECTRVKGTDLAPFGADSFFQRILWGS